MHRYVCSRVSLPKYKKDMLKCHDDQLAQESTAAGV